MRSLIICTLLLAATPLAATDDCEYSKPFALELDAGEATALEIDAEAGFLVVEGVDSARVVSVDATACASSDDLLSGIRLDSGRRGDHLWIEVDIPDNRLGRRHSARLDLTITVPSSLTLEIDDGSGSIDLRHVGPVELEDGSGEIEIEGLVGDLRIDDGSGEITVEGVVGNVVVRDGSGSATLRDIQGTVRIADDGSGEIEIADVRGDVEIDEDGSGGIDIRDVTGAVRIGSDGSGSIRIARVGGDFTLRDDGSGTIHVEEVRGVVRTP